MPIKSGIIEPIPIVNIKLKNIIVFDMLNPIYFFQYSF